MLVVMEFMDGAKEGRESGRELQEFAGEYG